MKRVLIISLFFGALFALLCLTGCGGGPDQCYCGPDSLTVEGFDVEMCSCDDAVSLGFFELSGCRMATSCIDCYCFPTACGYYENDLDSISHVVCGWDCTFWECYGDPSVGIPSDGISNVETRRTVSAEEGIHYRIDKVSLRLDTGDFETFTDDHINADDILALIAGISMVGDEAKIQLTVEYTALTELSSAYLSGDFIYKSYEFNNFSSGFSASQGNTGRETEKCLNIQPGKHTITSIVSLNMYEILALENITNIEFSASAYVEE